MKNILSKYDNCRKIHSNMTSARNLSPKSPNFANTGNISQNLGNIAKTEEYC
jgi:hypothetical protein